MAKKAEPAAQAEEDKNAKHLIIDMSLGDSRIRIYLLNPGTWFHGFGGSRHSLDVKKTASLIIRTTGPHGLHDIEHDIHGRDGKSLWPWIVDTLLKADVVRSLKPTA